MDFKKIKEEIPFSLTEIYFLTSGDETSEYEPEEVETYKDKTSIFSSNKNYIYTRAQFACRIRTNKYKNYQIPKSC